MFLTDHSPIKKTCSLGLQLAKAEFKLRNEGSYLGVVWYLLNPILLFTVLYVIFSEKLGTNIPDYPAYLLLGIILFNLFQTITTESTKAILKEYHYLIKSIQFQRESLILAIVLKHLFAHLFEIALFILVLACTHISIAGMICYIPLLFCFALFLYGISLLIAGLTVYVVDLDNIWNFAVRILWFATPIFYALDAHSYAHTINLINPLYYFITAGREMVIYQNLPSLGIVCGVLLYSIGFFVLGSAAFKSLKVKFAERI